MSVITDLEADLSLWKPQRLALRKLDATLNAIPDLRASTPEIAASLPGDLRFDTPFPSLCFAIATGCGKTRLMGAAISYLYKTRGYRNFFILTPGETIYRKTIQNFTQHHQKYVLQGYTDLPDFALITGDTYDRQSLVNRLMADDLCIYVFNIQKIFNPRTDVTFRFHRFQETLGASFADLLREKPDLVLLMDESHRYRGPSSLQAMSDLRPLLGLEFTATPLPHQHNVLYRYSLGEAIEDGLVKTPVVIGRSGQTLHPTEVERAKLADGLHLHRRKATLLEVYCRNHGLPIVRPLVLISGASTNHAETLKLDAESDNFFNGEYAGKVIRTHSKVSANDADIEELLRLEEPASTIEIVIHVNKLKEGWDVKNVYTIIPLRASVSDILTEQTIGRGLRLPFGQRTGDDELDRLDIVAHDHYQQVVQLANQYRKEYGYPFRTLDLGSQPPPPLVPRAVPPRADGGFLPKIPTLRARINVSANYRDAVLAPTRSYAPTTPELRGEKLVREPSSIYLGEAPYITGEDPVRYLARLLINQLSFVDSTEPSARQWAINTARSFLAQIDSDPSQWPTIVEAHAGLIFNDIHDQLESHLQVTTSVQFEPDARRPLIAFRAWHTAVEPDYSPPHKSAVPDHESVNRLIGGYEQTFFPENVFNSKEEKWFADIIDTDASVLSWVRPPRGQFVIPYAGGDYNPDFVLDTGDAYRVVEIKAANEVTDPDVIAKAHAGIGWCASATQVNEKPWHYYLIRHDDVHPGDTLAAVLGRAVLVPVSLP